MTLGFQMFSFSRVYPSICGRAAFQENVLLKNPTKSGIKAVMGVAAFSLTKVGRHDKLDVVWICFLFFFHQILYTLYISQIDKLQCTI